MKEWTTAMANQLREALERLERLRLPEYIAYVESRRRFCLMQLLGGIMRGLGMAIGFTVLGALLVAMLQGLAQRNLPVIGGFLADVVEIVQRNLE